MAPSANWFYERMFVYKIVGVNSKKGAIDSEAMWTVLGARITPLLSRPAGIAPPASSQGEKEASATPLLSAARCIAMAALRRYSFCSCKASAPSLEVCHIGSISWCGDGGDAPNFVSAPGLQRLHGGLYGEHD